MEKIREHILFEGRVQGVGFRYTASYLAKNFNITGWVRNNDDGRVEGEFQGLEQDIDKMIQELNQDRYIRIDRIDRGRIQVKENERRFSIKGY